MNSEFGRRLGIGLAVAIALLPACSASSGADDTGATDQANTQAHPDDVAGAAGLASGLKGRSFRVNQRVDIPEGKLDARIVQYFDKDRWMTFESAIVARELKDYRRWVEGGPSYVVQDITIDPTVVVDDHGVVAIHIQLFNAEDRSQADFSVRIRIVGELTRLPRPITMRDVQPLLSQSLVFADRGP